MLRWSAENTQRPVDLRAIADPDVDPLVPGGRELAELGRQAVSREVDRTAFDRVAAVLGSEAAVDAVCVAAAFEGFNRIVDATGLSLTRARRRELVEVIDLLDLGRFPHAG